MYHPIYPIAAPTERNSNSSSSNSAAAVYAMEEEGKRKPERGAGWWWQRGAVDSFCFVFSLRVGEILTNRRVQSTVCLKTNLTDDAPYSNL